jgi:hypothetical protein
METWHIILIVGAIALVIIVGVAALGRPKGRLSAEVRQNYTLLNGNYQCNQCEHNFPSTTTQTDTMQMRRHLSTHHAPAQSQPPAAININIQQQVAPAPAANDGANWLAVAAEWVRDHCCC